MERQLSNNGNKSVKEGYLTRCHVSHIISSKTNIEYYVLTSGSLDSYNNEHYEKLKKRYALALISDVEISGTPNEFVIISTAQTKVEFRTQSESECLEWVTALSVAAAKWHTSVNEDDINEEICVSLPTQSLPYQVCCSDCIHLHGECAMIKYARNGKFIPHERIFKVDWENLQILWRKPGRPVLRSFSFKCSLFIGDVIEVRFGQQTKNFNDFPYAEVEDQSFSLIFEKEQGEWCGLSSLDIICDSIAALENWKHGLQILVYGTDGKRAIRESYLVMDPIIIHLKRYWSIHAEKEMLSIDACSNIMWRLHQVVLKRVLKNFIHDILMHHFSQEYLNWDCFFFIFNLLCHRRQLYQEYRKYASSERLGMTASEFVRFLNVEQKVFGIDIQAAVALIKYHDKHNQMYKTTVAGDNPLIYQQSQNCLSFHGFVSYLRSADSAIMSERKEDMTQPLCHYFINSSHNTYLTGHQLKGLSSCEAYAYALLNGSRCLEIDCWDGPEEPMVTHGMTLTTKIKLRDVLDVIKAYAFDVSPYPVILSLENHCSQEQQILMAMQFTTIFGDMLATEDLCQNNTLPSPEQLKYKILLKGRALAKTKKSSRQARGVSRKWSTNSVVQSVYANPTTKLSTSVPSPAEDSEDELTPAEGTTEEQEIPLHSMMGSLIVYCQAVPYKSNTISLNCCEMHSLSENHAIALGETSPLDIVLMSQKKLLRSYPKGTRVESSNYNPMLMWQCGIQMAAINIQKPDTPTHINSGFFKKSDGCGYVLKPAAMIKPGCGYHPKMKHFHQTRKVTVQIVCGQFVNPDVFTGFPIFVEVQSVGVEESCDAFSTEVTTNTFNPVWEKGSHTFVILMPSLCVLYFKVFAVGRVNKLVYQNCFPVDMIQPGTRFVPLKSLTGVKRHENGLFVKLDITQNMESKQENKLGNPWRSAVRKAKAKNQHFPWQSIVRSAKANAT